MNLLVQYAIPLLIVALSLESKSLNLQGSLTALLLAYTILLTQNIFWLAVVFSFFIIGVIVTKLNEERKDKMKLLQKVRGPKNVMANAGVAMLMAILGGNIATYGFIGSIAAATSDTVSSEVGVLSKGNAIMITNFKKAKKGINGAISFLGTFAGAIATILIGIISLMIMPATKTIFIALFAGMIGNFADSYIGAVFENRGWWGNSTTNMFATTVGAIAGMIIGVLL